MTERSNGMAGNYIYRPDFKTYNHDNPYHDRLKVFDGFVMRDEEAEAHQGRWRAVFGNDFQLSVEIGTGYGDFMIEWCRNNPTSNFVGLDHRFKRSFTLAKLLDKQENRNFRYLRARGERLEWIFGESEVNNLFYFFPDPWPKTRHHKKRLFQKPFLDAVHRVLAPGGTLFVKTDHEGYYEWMLRELGEDPRFEVLIKSMDTRQEHPEHFLTQYTTKFEKIFLAKGVLIKSLVLKNVK